MPVKRHTAYGLSGKLLNLPFGKEIHSGIYGLGPFKTLVLFFPSYKRYKSQKAVDYDGFFNVFRVKWLKY